MTGQNKGCLGAIAAHWRQHFMLAELLLAICLWVVFVCWAESPVGRATLDELLEGRMANIYGVLASIAASLLGFELATVSIILGFSQSPRLKVVRSGAHYSTLWKVFTSTIRWLAASTCMFLVGLVYAHKAAPEWLLLYPSMFLLMASLFRLGRTIWVLEQIIFLVTDERAGGS